MKHSYDALATGAMICSLFLSGCVAPTPKVSTLAGGSEGFANGAGTAAQFRHPSGVAVDGNGNVYVADMENHRIRKISPDGMVATFAGNGTQGYKDGAASVAQFNFPERVAVDQDGNVYVSDTGNDLVRKISTDGTVSTFAGRNYYLKGFTPETKSADISFYSPEGLAVDKAGNVFVADASRNEIFKVTSDGTAKLLAGGNQGFTDGPCLEARFNRPYGIALDTDGNVLIAERWNHSVRKITTDGSVTTITGGTQGFADGPISAAQFDRPFAIAADKASILYVADRWNHCIRKISADGVVTTLAGNGNNGNLDGEGIEARFNFPSDVAVDRSGNLYVADSENHSIRKISF